jgi:DNA-binding SARP family transcriptional activator
MLARLLLDAGRAVAVDDLIDALWGEEPPDSAVKMIHVYVSHLRKSLPAGLLCTRPPGYALELAGEDVLDLNEFERLRTAGRLRDALALWRGPPMAEFSEPFAARERARLEERRLGCLEERLEADLACGAADELVPELEVLVAAHPLRERPRRQLMLALYRAGRQAEALQQYHDARRELVDELGVEPGPALQELYRSILRQEGRLERAAPAPRRNGDQLGDVVKALLGGRIVLVLGSGANGGDRPPGSDEIASHLARSFDCPPEHARDLAHVAQYVSLVKGAGPLYDELHSLYEQDRRPAAPHQASSCSPRTTTSSSSARSTRSGRSSTWSCTSRSGAIGGSSCT